MADSSAPQIPTTKSYNVQNANTRGRSFSRKRDKQVTFKTQGQSFDMCKLVETTMLKPEIIQTVVSTIIGEIKTELISERNKIRNYSSYRRCHQAITRLHK